MTKIYLAPLEGITDSIYRNTYEKYYGGVEKYFTPFLSPNSTHKFTTKEFNNINPNKNDVSNTVPQLLTNNAKHFLWAAEQLVSMGYREINFNLGCPSGTVVAKKKGSGLLYYPELLDQTLYEIYDGLENFGADKPFISIKTRLGKNDPEEFYEILEIYNKYKISELTVHPRIQTDFYRENIRREYFDYAYKHSKNSLVYNGDLNTVDDIKECENRYPDITAVMLGRGLIGNPQLAREYTVGNREVLDFDDKNFWQFHDELLAQYKELLSGETPLLHRIKEFWGFWQYDFVDNGKLIKKIRKANKLADYQSVIAVLR